VTVTTTMTKPMNYVTLYTDGSCEGNPGPGGYAAIVDVGGKRRELSGADPKTTNNRMELSAVIAGLRSLDEPSMVKVVTDSQYVVKGMTEWIHAWRRKGWRSSSGSAVKNRDLWEELDALARKHRVRWEWIRGHNGHPENERADALAREAIRSLD
jgi:ribonuclease HI